jgi:hypothetical protein
MCHRIFSFLGIGLAYAVVCPQKKWVLIRHIFHSNGLGHKEKCGDGNFDDQSIYLYHKFLTFLPEELF